MPVVQLQLVAFHYDVTMLLQDVTYSSGQKRFPFRLRSVQGSICRTLTKRLLCPKTLARTLEQTLSSVGKSTYKYLRKCSNTLLFLTHVCPFLFIQLDFLFRLHAELIGWLATDRHPDWQRQ